ncbi:MAG: hypothetical protein CMJ83_16755 [Planctomycetes bacterium]|jgi:hypothetical protein|nr:hypothetical protein [Planctomycetota bacterium]
MRLAVLLIAAVATAAHAQPLFTDVPLANDAKITLTATWSKIVDSTYQLHESTDLYDLSPAKRTVTYHADDLTALLPENGDAPVDGLYRLDPERVIRFMKQFHPGARVHMHHGTGKGGGFASLLGSGDRYDIAFRVHADFRIADGTWFTPAGFEGRLILDKKGRPLYLKIALIDRNTNVDLNHAGMADIVYVPKMMLEGGDAKENHGRSFPRKKLARAFYPFLDIKWRPFAKAWPEASAADQRLHVMVLFGTLDDESC